MAWEVRRGKRYYYYKKRVDGVPRSVYVGSSPLAEAIASLDAATTFQRTAARERAKSEIGEALGLDRQEAGRFRQTMDAYRGAMETVGYHRHDRGSWRRRRGMGTVEKVDRKVEINACGLSHAEVAKLIEKGSKGDHAAALAYFDSAKAHGTENQMVDLLTHRRQCVLNASYKTDQILNIAMGRKMKQIEAGLNRRDASPTALLLVEEAVMCWLRVTQAEQQLTRHMAQPDGYTLSVALFYDKMLDRAHRRYVQALHALATVRRLHIPAVQVNIGANQVNTVQNGPAPVASVASCSTGADQIQQNTTGSEGGANP